MILADAVFDGVPTFFYALCLEARSSEEGYWTPGYHLAIHLDNLIPYDFEDSDSWTEMVENLKQASDDELMEWLCHYYPKCMARVPKRRRERFLRGMRDRWEWESE